MTPYERGYAAALKAAADAAKQRAKYYVAEDHTPELAECARTCNLLAQRILSLPIVGEATNPGEPVAQVMYEMANDGKCGPVAWFKSPRSLPDGTMLYAHPAQPGPSQECVMVPREMLEEWLRWTSARQAIAGNSHHHDSMQEQMRAMLAAKEEHSQHLRNEGLRISAESVDAVDREEHDAHR